MNKKIILLTIAVLMLFAVIATADFTYTKIGQTTPRPEDAMGILFNLGVKKPGTKIYYSEKLGVGFTYLPDNWTEITEIGNKIYLHHSENPPEDGQSVEVFTKDPQSNLQDAIRERFLKGIDPKVCFVEISPSPQGISKYIAGSIDFPIYDGPDGPWWKNGANCPQKYSLTNGVRYFLMNTDAPGKFLFVNIGQDAIVLDGTKVNPSDQLLEYNWDRSLRIK